MRIGIGLEAAGTAGVRFRLGGRYHHCHIVAYTDRSLYAIDVLFILFVQAIAIILASSFLAHGLGIQANGSRQQPYIIHLGPLPWNDHPGLAIAVMLVKVVILAEMVDTIKLSYRSMLSWWQGWQRWLAVGPRVKVGVAA